MPALSVDSQRYTSGKKCEPPMCHVNNGTIRPQGHRGCLSFLVPLRYSVCSLDVESFEIRYFGNLALTQRSVLTSQLGCSYTQILSSVRAAASGLTCGAHLRKYFVSCQHHWNIFTRCESQCEYYGWARLCVVPMPLHFMGNAFSIA